MKLEVSKDIEETELNRIKNVFRTQLDYYVCGAEIKDRVIILTFKRCRENAKEEKILYNPKTKEKN